MLKRYPIKVAPERGYRHRLPMISLLEKYPQLAVARRSKDKDIYVYSSNGKHKTFRTGLFQDNLIEMSVNLLGGRFKIKHLPFVPKIELVNKDWDGKSVHDKYLSKNEYSLESECGVIFFRVAQVNAFSFPYLKKIEQVDDYNALKTKAIQIHNREKINVDGMIVGAFGGKKAMTDVHARLHVNHHPNALNYWHMQIDVYPAGSEQYLHYNDTSKEARRIRQQMRMYIEKIAICKLRSRYRILKEYYAKGQPRLAYCCDKFVGFFDAGLGRF